MPGRERSAENEVPVLCQPPCVTVRKPLIKDAGVVRTEMSVFKPLLNGGVRPDAGAGKERPSDQRRGAVSAHNKCRPGFVFPSSLPPSDLVSRRPPRNGSAARGPPDIDMGRNQRNQPQIEGMSVQIDLAARVLAYSSRRAVQRPYGKNLRIDQKTCRQGKCGARQRSLRVRCKQTAAGLAEPLLPSLPVQRQNAKPGRKKAGQRSPRRAKPDYSYVVMPGHALRPARSIFHPGRRPRLRQNRRFCRRAPPPVRPVPSRTAHSRAPEVRVRPPLPGTAWGTGETLP